MEQNKKGGISVETEHIFPIIKKWLYSEKEIFLREIVSNASDAVTKLRRLASLGKYESDGDAYRIDVSFSKLEKTLTVTDNGIGMTEEELEKYICNMALSGALDFIQQYENEKEDGKNGIIGHFGLGFYSSFMVADTVEIITASYTGADAVHWICTEDGSYEIQNDTEAHARGTSVIMHINEESEEYLDEGKLREILDKYCAFMPVEIFLIDEDKEDEGKTEENAEAPIPVNDVVPLWQKSASEISDEEYNAFYTKVFRENGEPLFHLHLNADYPLCFKGIIYFPRLRENYESLEGKVRLFYNQVFVADNIKEVLPEYLLMLRGVLDCPELPLNVSRSYLQNSAYVAKLSRYIAKKVADKLTKMFKNEREKYEGMWQDLKTFASYAAVCERSFYDQAKAGLLLTLSDGKRVPVSEAVEASGEKKILYYTTDAVLQAQYISMYTARGVSVYVADSLLDERFFQMLEMYENVKFVRVDAGTEALREEDDKTEADEGLSALFVDLLGEGKKLTVKQERFADTDVPAVLTVSEEARRMEEMMRMYAPDMPRMATDAVLILNTASPIVSRLAQGAFGEKASKVAKYIYSLALISHRPLNAEEMKQFLSDSYAILSEIA